MSLKCRCPDRCEKHPDPNGWEPPFDDDPETIRLSASSED